jgi:hypothetical protein
VTVAIIVSLYAVGCWATFVVSGIGYLRAGHRLVGTILLWPLFVVKHFALALRAGIAALRGQQEMRDG